MQLPAWMPTAKNNNNNNNNNNIDRTLALCLYCNNNKMHLYTQYRIIGPLLFYLTMCSLLKSEFFVFIWMMGLLEAVWRQ